MDDTSTIDRISPCKRPDESVAGFHCWHHLLFLHWRVPATVLQPLVPQGLTIDTFDGDAWIGLVPFSMSNVRPFWSPPIPGVSRFHETNVRTYVHRDGRDPGVWFFSLDAASLLAVTVARLRWSLPYFRASLNVRVNGQETCFSGKRWWSPTTARYRIEALLHGVPQPADPGTLEHFLIERYLLYARSRQGTILRGQVHHAPYEICDAQIDVCEQSMMAVNGIDISDEPVHAAYCRGVDVEVFALRDV